MTAWHWYILQRATVTCTGQCATIVISPQAAVSAKNTSPVSNATDVSTQAEDSDQPAVPVSEMRNVGLSG